MLQHIVLFKTNPGLAPEIFDRIIADALQQLTTIPGVINLRAGTPLDESVGWDIGLSMEFASREELEEYRKHPIHIAYVQENLDENVLERKALDFWMKQNENT